MSQRIKEQQHALARMPQRCFSLQRDQSENKKMNLVGAINDALRIALETDPQAVIFGEDVGFGGVFRATAGLQVAKP